MQVKNLNGTTSKTCKCGSWLEHLRNYRTDSHYGRDEIFEIIDPIKKCAVIGCNQSSEVGGHVQKSSIYSLDQNWYIIPLCKNHNNQRGATLEIKNNTPMALANVSKTCG